MEKTPLFVQFLKGKQLYDEFCRAYREGGEDHARKRQADFLPIEEFFKLYANSIAAINNAFFWEDYCENVHWVSVHRQWKEFLKKRILP